MILCPTNYNKIVYFQVSAQAGQNVTLVDLSPEVLAKSQKSIGANLGRVAKKVYKDKPQEGEKFVAESMARIKTSTDPAAAAKSADLVVEAIVENMGVKHKLFQQLDAVFFFYYSVWFTKFKQ